eukprot:250835-Pelagomonas_calceolata.AAC.1
MMRTTGCGSGGALCTKPVGHFFHLSETNVASVRISFDDYVFGTQPVTLASLVLAFLATPGELLLSRGTLGLMAVVGPTARSDQ